MHYRKRLLRHVLYHPDGKDALQEAPAATRPVSSRRERCITGSACCDTSCIIQTVKMHYRKRLLRHVLYHPDGKDALQEAPAATRPVSSRRERCITGSACCDTSCIIQTGKMHYRKRLLRHVLHHPDGKDALQEAPAVTRPVSSRRERCITGSACCDTSCIIQTVKMHYRKRLLRHVLYHPDGKDALQEAPAATRPASSRLKHALQEAPAATRPVSSRRERCITGSACCDTSCIIQT